ncbi:cyclopropane fatty acyl phospholipid synthase [Nannocystis pusilla]|uniref:Cyclopropane fatty acyl phospholipid synthase n=1 Tax=Nannocystis pusilla TaxID=889268 RepID=A0ABS7TWB8_9BACT|nr:cyclopropane fatty acyl phospholipid synthase [Nannocystis pusilla]
MGSLDSAAQRAVVRALGRAGARVGGPDPWDIHVHDPRFWRRVALGGSLALGDSYMDGWWDCAAIDELTARVLATSGDEQVLDWRTAALATASRLLNLQTIGRSSQVAEVHYDLDTELFAAMLGPTMAYSCAYWKAAADLDAAQRAKFELVCAKLYLGTGEKLLDIGCGWGGLVRHAIATRGARAVGITVSAPQRDWAAEHDEGHGGDYHTLDWRDRRVAALGPFDKIASVGMFEHVGHRNYRAFFATAHRLLRDDGLLLLHTIGNEHGRTDAWLNRHIFPNGALPATADISEAVRGLFVIEDWHNLRADYDPTIMAWHANFMRHAESRGSAMPTRFRRMWSYYLQTMAGSFRAGCRNQLWQIALSKRGVRGGYRSIR